MHKLYALAALALITSPALAGDTYSFEIGGRRIHIDVPDNCDDLSCVSISLPAPRDERGRPARPLQQSTPLPIPRPPTDGAGPPVASLPPPPPPSASAAPIQPTPAPPPAAQSSPPAIASAPPAAQPVAPPSSAATSSPIGIWVTEKNEGRVRIEPCGQNLCGYALQGNANGKQVLIDMKQIGDNRWSGRINDVKHGGIYQSNITMQTANDLRVEGCAFGGMICGGQTWRRE